MQEDQISQTPTVDNPQTTVMQTVDEKPKKNNFLVILLSILMLLALAIAGFFAYQTQKLAKELSEFKNQNLATPTSEPESTFPMYTEPNSPIADWKTYKVNELGIEFKLPKQLGMLENSGKEINGDAGTQYCLVYEGSLSFKIIKQAFASGGACSGRNFVIGATSTDYEADRMGGFGDYQGYFSQDNQFYVKSVLNKSFAVSPRLGREITNKNGVKILIVMGKNNTEENNFPIEGTPGDGFAGALINLPEGSKYSGFNISMKFSSLTEYAIFDQILSTFRYLPNTSSWKSYTDPFLNYKIKYPTELTVDSNPSENGGVAEFRGQNRYLSIGNGNFLGQSDPVTKTVNETDIEIASLKMHRKVITPLQSHRYGVIYTFSAGKNSYFAEFYSNNYQEDLPYYEDILSTIEFMD